MKYLSLWQPWATAIALGSKRIETRSWATAHRGPLVIHASSRKRIYEMIAHSSTWHWRAALEPLLRGQDDKFLDDLLPFGAFVAVCDLVDCRPSESFTVGEIQTPRLCAKGHKWTESQMGDFSPGRFGWVLANIRPLPRPIPFKALQRLQNVPAHLVAEINAQLTEDTDVRSDATTE